MKKIFLLMFAVVLLAFAGCSKQTTTSNPDPPGVKVEYAFDQVTVSEVTPDASGPVYTVQEVTKPPGEADKTFWQLIADNWGTLALALLGFIELLVRLTPSDKDNSIFNVIYKLLNAIIPNLKKGGGTFAIKTE